MSLKTGLTTNRAYAVLDFRPAGSGPDDLGAFVQLRNTAPEYPWRGNWAEGSELWAAHATTAEALRPDFTAGRFWMAFDDFAFVFNEVGLCNERGSAAEELRLQLAVTPDGHAEVMHFLVPSGAEVQWLALTQRWELPRGAPAQTDFGALLLDFETREVLAHVLPTQSRAAALRLALGSGEYLLYPFGSSWADTAGGQALTAHVGWEAVGLAKVEAQVVEADEELLWEATRVFIRAQVASGGGGGDALVARASCDRRFVMYKARLGCLYVAALELLRPLVGCAVRFKIDCSQSCNLLPVFR